MPPGFDGDHDLVEPQVRQQGVERVQLAQDARPVDPYGFRSVVDEADTGETAHPTPRLQGRETRGELAGADDDDAALQPVHVHQPGKGQVHHHRDRQRDEQGNCGGETAVPKAGYQEQDRGKDQEFQAETGHQPREDFGAGADMAPAVDAGREIRRQEREGDQRAEDQRLVERLRRFPLSSLLDPSREDAHAEQHRAIGGDEREHGPSDIELGEQMHGEPFPSPRRGKMDRAFALMRGVPAGRPTPGHSIPQEIPQEPDQPRLKRGEARRFRL